MSLRRAAVASAIFVIGCNAILGINEPNVVDADGGAPDASSGVDAGENLIKGGDLDHGCAGWTGANIFPFTPGRGDAGGACLVCSTGTEDFGVTTIAVEGAGVVKVGDGFLYEVWVKSAPSEFAPNDVNLEAELDGPAGQGAQYQEPNLGALKPPPPDWSVLTGTLQVTTPDAGEVTQLRMNVAVRDSRDAGGARRCFLMDDAVIRRTN